MTTLIGGKTKQKMINPPIEYCDLLVTTLGAFSKLVTTGIFKIHNVHHVVLDEADSLLDDSFIGKMSNLMKKFSVSLHLECFIVHIGLLSGSKRQVSGRLGGPGFKFRVLL